jgi:acyl-coenzyme A thioesterase PaaI-like protein
LPIVTCERRNARVASLRSLKNSDLCFGCGKENEAGLRLDFEIRPDGKLETRFSPRPTHGGWEGVFHGGLMATLLDEAMMAYLYRTGTNAATASLEVRFREPVAIGEQLVVTAWEEGRRGRLVRMVSEARRDGIVVAEGRSRCLVIED